MAKGDSHIRRLVLRSCSRGGEADIGTAVILDDE